MRTFPLYDHLLLGVLWRVDGVNVKGLVVSNELRVCPELLSVLLEMRLNFLDHHLHLLGRVEHLHLLVLHLLLVFHVSSVTELAVLLLFFV